MALGTNKEKIFVLFCPLSAPATSLDGPLLPADLGSQNLNIHSYLSLFPK